MYSLLVILSTAVLVFCNPHGRVRRDDVDDALLSVWGSGQDVAASTHDLDAIADYKVCGVNGKKIAKISGPGEANPKDWPWLAGILRAADQFHFCGGALITRRHVLTASHCLPQGVTADKILIRLGEYDFTTTTDSISTDVPVEEIRTHENYDTSTYENDIAILKLARAVEYGPYVQPVCLPPPGPRYTNQTAIVSGWGTLFYGGPKPDVLMEVPVPIWEQETCRSSFTQTIFDTTMCAAGYEGGKDSCQGDSGGPLMIQRDDDRWMTVGVVSWGIKCARKGRPGVYTRVNDYLTWIADRVTDL